MAVLTTKKRKALPKGKFALPAQRKYPINDRAHAANAKARVEQQYKAGNVSKSTRDRVDAAANKVLKKKK
jgi:hypothetical protein